MTAATCFAVRRTPGCPLFRTYLRPETAAEVETLRRHLQSSETAPIHEWIVVNPNAELMTDQDRVDWKEDAQ